MKRMILVMAISIFIVLLTNCIETVPAYETYTSISPLQIIDIENRLKYVEQETGYCLYVAGQQPLQGTLAARVADLKSLGSQLLDLRIEFYRTQEQVTKLERELDNLKVQVKLQSLSARNPDPNSQCL